MMNEKKPTWICAVCDKNISYDDLYIDAYMEEVTSWPEITFKFFLKITFYY